MDSLLSTPKQVQLWQKAHTLTGAKTGCGALFIRTEISLRKVAIAMGVKSACGASGRQTGLRSLMWSTSRMARMDNLPLERTAFGVRSLSR